MDDDVEDLDRLQRDLQRIREEFHLSWELSLRRFERAEPVAEAILASADEPAFDLVVADVVMPPSGPGVPGWSHGAFRIAEAIESRYKGQPRTPTKLAAVTNLPRYSRHFERFLREDRGWFSLFPKGKPDPSRADLLSDAAWLRALFYTVHLVESDGWGQPDLAGELTFCSAAGREVFDQVRSAAEDTRVTLVAMTGPRGNGPEYLALLLHSLRWRIHGAEGKVRSELLPSGDWERHLCDPRYGVLPLLADGCGGLHLRLEHLPPSDQLKAIERAHAALARRRLVTFEGGDEAMQRDLPSRFGEQCRVISCPHLSDMRDDLVPTALSILGKTCSLDEEAQTWLQQSWDGDLNELKHLLRQASVGGRRKRVSAKDLQEIDASRPSRARHSPPAERSDQTPEAGSEASRPKFVRTEAGWEISYQSRTVQMPALNGLTMLAHLVSRPGVPVSAYDLRALLPGSPRTEQSRRVLRSRKELLTYEDNGALGPERGFRAFDGEAKREINDAIKCLKSKAEYEADPEARAKLLEEIEQLKTALKRGTREQGDPAERARRAVLKNITDAIKHITRVDAADLAQHFTDHVRTGLFTTYGQHGGSGC
ncbi:MAG: hypothetical protein KIT58_08370 [Planctomycetota bacterium]|nr:hypothetical protein [Planctomycetota bacterium]